MSTIIFVALPYLQRCILYFSRKIRHIHARANEWYRVHRSGGSGGNGRNWVKLLAILAGVWFVCQAFLWVVDLIRDIIQGVAEFLVALTPVALLIIIVAGVVVWYQQHKRGI